MVISCEVPGAIALARISACAGSLATDSVGSPKVSRSKRVLRRQFKELAEPLTETWTILSCNGLPVNAPSVSRAVGHVSGEGRACVALDDTD